MGLIESEAEAIAWVHQMAKTPTPGDHEVADPHPYCLGDDPCCCVQLIAACETARADERIKAAGRVDAAGICNCDPYWEGFHKGEHRDWCVQSVALAAIREAE